MKTIILPGPKFYKVLLLEDEDIRVEQFKKMFYLTGAKITNVKSATSCIKELEANKFDIIFLDHDLGIEETGYDVAKWIYENPIEGIVVVHSMNSPARERMCSLIPNAISFPLVWNQKNFIK